MWQLWSHNQHQKKTEVVDQPAPGKPYKKPTITVKSQRLQVVDKIIYLGSTLSRVVHIDDEVNARIAKASAAFGRLRGSIWPRWLSWMRRPTGDQEVAGSTPAEVGNILSWRLIMKYFLRSFSPFRWFKKGRCQFLAKEWAQYWLTA